jgi:tetratricopeptide (TPR) repeat protein
MYSCHLLVINKLNECIHYSYKAFEFFDKMGYDRDAADSLKCSIKAYRKLGEYEKALDISEKVNEILCRSYEPSTLVTGGEE